MARPVGLEPTAYRFEVWRSIQLSYGRTLRSQYATIRGGKSEGNLSGLEWGG